MKKLALILIAIFINIAAYSAFLKNIPVDLKQPDGTIIHCFITGDEFHRRVHDKDNYTIVQNPKSGFYVYAIKSGGELVPTEYVVGKNDPKQMQLEPNLDISVRKMEEKRTEILKSAKITSIAQSFGKFYNMVVFIRFADDEEFTDNLESYSSRFNDNKLGANSVCNYYKEASYGQLDVVSAFYPVSKNGNILSYQDVNQRNFYMPYTLLNPIGYKGGIEYTERKSTLLGNALKSIKVDLENAVNLDGNDDGIIDNICFIIKGQPAEWGDLLWPHMSSFWDRNISINGKQAGIYNLQVEQALGKAGQGVLCHELFHSLGAPDLYHYNGDGNSPVGPWDIMEANSNPPQHMSAYMKYKYGKWMQSIPEITESGTYYLKPLLSNSKNCFKIASPNSTTEYFVIEYRKKIGTFENSLPDEGLLIYRINSALEFPGNSSGPPDEVYVFRPQGSFTNNGNLIQAAFSSNFNKTFINDNSDPCTFLSDGVPGGLEISNIGTLGDSITFTYKKGKPYQLALTSPIGGEIFQTSTKTNITWINKGTSDIKIEYSLDDSKWNLIDNITNQTELSDGNYTWTLPNEITQKAKIRICNKSDNTVFSCSKSFFSISPKGRLFENEPNSEASLAGKIELGDIFEGEISPEGDVDYYKFIATKGDTLDIFAQALNSRLRGQIKIYSSTGTDIGEANDYGGIWTNQRLSFKVPETGDYLLRYSRSADPGIFPKSGIIGEDSFQDSILNSINSQSLAVGKYTITLRKFYSSAPVIQVAQAEDRTLNSATLRTDIHTNGSPTCVSFSYGETSNYGNIIEPKFNCFDIFNQTWVFNAPISGLKPNTTYHFRTIARNTKGTTYGFDGMFKTADEPKYWERQVITENYHDYVSEDSYNSVIPIDNLTYFIVGYVGLLKTTDGGKRWNKILEANPLHEINLNSGFHHGFFINKSIGWLIGSEIYKTIDGGNTWTKQKNPTDKVLESISFSDENHGIAVGWQGIILKTDNGGNTWIAQDTLRPDHSWFRLNDVQMIDNNLAYAVGDFGTIIKTMDGGKSWTNLKTNFGTPHFNSLDFVDSLVGYIAVNNGIGIIWTFDGGTTWKEQDNASGKVQIGVNFYNKKKGIIVGKLGSIAVTDDGGATWTAHESGYRDDLNDVHFIDSTKAIIVGNFQTILKTIDLNKKEITLKSPSGGEVWDAGSVHEIIWQKNNVSKVHILFSTDILNTKWDTIASNILASTNSFKWLVPDVISQNCKIRIISVEDKTVMSENSSQFSISSLLRNQPPVANAGADQTVNEVTTVTLDGSQSSDVDHDNLTYKWTAPAGITLSSLSAQKPTFITPEVTKDTQFTFTLVVNDGTLDSPADQVVISAKQVNKAPVANAGADQTVNEGTTVVLDCSQSTDLDLDNLIYKWTSPPGISLNLTSSQKPTFKAPEIKKDSTIIFSLIVNDGFIDSSPSAVKINVLNVIKVGIDNVSKSVFMVYPNPTTGVITIKGLSTNKMNEIVIQSVDGNLIQKKSTSSETETIDIGDQASGTYLLVINNQTFKIQKK